MSSKEVSVITHDMNSSKQLLLRQPVYFSLSLIRLRMQLGCSKETGKPFSLVDQLYH